MRRALFRIACFFLLVLLVWTSQNTQALRRHLDRWCLPPLSVRQERNLWGDRALDVHGESIVLAGEEPSLLLFPPSASGPLMVRNTYLPGLASTVVYTAGTDYLVDRANGTIRRLPGSRIPDYATHPWFGGKLFGRDVKSLVSNRPFFVYIDYLTDRGSDFAATVSKKASLASFPRGFDRAASFTILLYGDSISAGAEVSQPDLAFFSRYISGLRSRYPEKTIRDVNVSRGGMTSADGVASLTEAVFPHHPDLVLIGFGMNDFDTPLEAFKRNLRQIGEETTKTCNAELAYLSAFPANPDWYFFKASRRMPELAAATKEVAESLGAHYIPIFETWMKVLTRKDFPSLLANNLNHPNDFGHWLYFLTLDSLR